MRFSSHPFWQSLTDLVNSSELIIDRPKGTSHPNYPEIIYPLDYGYLQGTCAPDGKEVDVWLGSLQEKRVVGVAVTIDLAKRDTEIKVLLGLTDEEIEIIRGFHNRSSQSAVVVRHSE